MTPKYAHLNLFSECNGLNSPSVSHQEPANTLNLFISSGEDVVLFLLLWWIDLVCLDSILTGISLIPSFVFETLSWLILPEWALKY